MPRLPQLRLAVVLCFGCAMSAEASDDDLVRRARDGHRAARESIRTFTATICVEHAHPKSEESFRGQYWRTDNAARIHSGQRGAHTSDATMKGGEIRQIGLTWRPGAVSPDAIAYRLPGTALFGVGDVWPAMLIEMTGPAGMQADLDRTLEGSDGAVEADRDVIEGRECIRLRYGQTYPSGARCRLAQWHDVGRNYLICKVVVEYPNSPSSRGEMRVLEYIEPEPGVIFPIKVRRESYRDGELVSASVASLTNVVINKPLPIGALDLPVVPRGTTLKDYIAGNEGPIDSDWKPLGGMKPLAPSPVPPSPKATPADAPTAPSTSEAVSSSRWVLSGALAALVLAAGAVVARRVRARRSAA